MQKRIKISLASTLIIGALFLSSFLAMGILGTTKAQTIQTSSETIQYSPDGKGYLKEIANGKYYLHLEGSPYEMGYQAGYLDPSSVARLASEDWFRSVAYNILDAPEWAQSIVFQLVLGKSRLKDVCGDVLSDETIDQYDANLGDSIEDMMYKMLGLCSELIDAQIEQGYVPQEFLTEMKGVRDGAQDAGYDVTLQEVYLLNLGMDALLTLGYPVATDFLRLMDMFNLHACAGFVAQDGATTNGQTIMGRHFQFTDYITHEEMCIIEFSPNNGNEILATSCAGFVGVTAGMNNQGIGIGMDMSPAKDCDPAHFGMGTLLTTRYALQYCDQGSEVVNFIESIPHGCTWIYGIGDGRNGETGGCALEVSANHIRERTMDYEHPWWHIFGVRDQIEEKDDLVTYTNHYIHVRMNDLSDAVSIDDSKDRYSWITNDALSNYGNIDLETGCTIINYLSPAIRDYYGDDITQTVKTSITCWDLTNLQGKALFGHYDDSWVSFGF